MRKNKVTKLMTGMLAASMLLSMTADVFATGEQTTISLYTTLPGKDAEFEALIAEFMEKNPDINVDYIAYDSGEKQKWMSLYASGEAPNVSIMDAVDIMDNQENMLAYDPEEVGWMSEVDSTYLDVFKGDDGQIYGIPDTVQAMGLLYNKTTIEKATGETFDPSTIKTIDDLEALFQKIQDGGVSPAMFTGVDWSLGSHFLSQVFTGIRGDAEAQKSYIEDVKAGNVDLKADEGWNNVMDLFDLIAKYNYNSADPLVGNTDVDGQAMAEGKVAMWFMGDWGWDYIKEVATGDDEYGVMACPLTHNAEDAINQQLGVFTAKGFCIDASQSSEAEQEASKRFVEFLCFGNQQALADLVGVAIPFKNANVTYSSPIIQSTQSYIESGSTYSTYAFSRLLPSDFWSENGATMQQYLAGQCSREDAANAIQAYWESQN